MVSNQQEPIAIIGSACRFPGNSDTPSKLWELLLSPRDLTKRVPTDRFDISPYYHPDSSHHGTTNCQQSYFLEEDISQFDNSFFNIQPSEAEAIDPQQRILMETVYDSLCSAGQTIEGLRGSSTGVYVGIMCDDWSKMQNRDWGLIHTYTATGISRSIISNRISYYFDWHGPSMTIDTACSSSLVCVHQAVQALRNGESRVAIAAGANLILCPGAYLIESKMSMLSPTGRSRMWDADADGYARGEGIAAVVLKPLGAALEDGDHIECIIRGSGVNQDGRTAGMTMPSNISQADLIKSTYARAGLDLNDPKDRPQFFHAHGTGTQAGDPQEAEAISRAFFEGSKSTDTLYVGSIKTTIGHTESTAGLASLISTSQALQHGVIPPNLHLNRLNPRVAPFCAHLEVPVEAKPWPSPVSGQPRRASINSFGFGGTNAHVILEQYEKESFEQVMAPSFTPLVISAASKKSLKATLSELRNFLERKPYINLRDLAYTLNTRRSTLSFRQVISGMNVEEVIHNIESTLDGDDSKLSIRSFNVSTPKILGIFTGQGAQWPRMGAQLIEESPFASNRLEELDGALSSLPEDDRPQWSLKEQLLAHQAISRLSEAAISQPLCTAIQIILVDLLKVAGINLYAVVGHSSGEICAAYAAGFLTCTDAIRIAYYRGLYAKFAQSPGGGKGSMMAVGTSFDDALELCELEHFEGRLEVAAHNSLASITLSGDEDAIAEAIEIFEDEGKFARQLKVDTAYHSRHMQPCAVPYLDAINRCQISVNDDNGPTWYSSVLGGKVMTKEDLRSEYWVENMTQTVLFSSAVTSAVQLGGPFDLAIEIGPHPALKGPALNAIQEVMGKPVPYSGVLSRNKNDVVEFASALGFTWINLGVGSVDFDKFEKVVSDVTQPKSLLTDLPKYPFDHSRPFMMLTRVSGGHINNHSPPHPLLGRRCFERETNHQIQWRNFLIPKELRWLDGHKLEGQTVFPATGYIAMAIEAMSILAADKPIGLINLENFVITRAMTFSEGEVAMESLVTLTIVHSSEDELRAEFTCSSGLPFDNSSSMVLNSKATITFLLHEPAPDTLPSLRTEYLSLADVEVDTERFYAQLTHLGYNYGGPFKSVKSIYRKKDLAIGTIEDRSEGNWEDQLIVHPCLLDASLQTGFAAYSYPQDERLWTLHIPTSSSSITINPYFTRLGAGNQRVIPFQSVIHDSQKPHINCDIELFAGEDGSCTFVQIESLKLKPFSPATPDSDAILFSSFHYKLSEPDGVTIVGKDHFMPPEKISLMVSIERLSFFYLKSVVDQITPLEKASSLPHYQFFLDWAEDVVKTVSGGKHPTVPREAVNDTAISIKDITSKYTSDIAVKLIQAVGENISNEIRQNGSVLEHMMKDGMLGLFYEDSHDSVGRHTSNIWIGRMISQIAHRYPRLRILEIGAGTGGATSSILSELGSAFANYTYTDISAGFFERAQVRFKDFGERMVFKTFDMEKPPIEQGYTEGSYDVVVASNVLHATERLDRMMANVRKLLKPGGYLVMLELANNDCLHLGAVMGGLPGWWAGATQNKWRRSGPGLTLPQWDKLALAHGFAGIETAIPSMHRLHPYSVFACRAVDYRIDLLRNPLFHSAEASIPNLVVVGGHRTLESDQLVGRVCTLLGQKYAHITHLDSLQEANENNLPVLSSVLCITDLDEPFLKERSSSKLEALKTLWRRSGTILWVSQGSRDDNPHSSMLLGLSRAMRYEYPNITLQMLDLDAITRHTPQVLAETLIRPELLREWKKDRSIQAYEFLWSLEPELVCKGGQLLIPRMYPHKAGNNRYNTYRRQVRQTVDPKKQNFALEPSGQSFKLSGLSPLHRPDLGQFTNDRRMIQVSHSLLQMIIVENAGYFMLCSGTAMVTGQHIIALCNKAEIPATALAEWMIALPSAPCAELLVSVAAHILSKSIISVAPQVGSVLIHEADPILRDAIITEATQSGVTVIFSSSTRQIQGNNILFIQPNLPTRVIKKLLPRNISLFVNLAQNPGANEVGEIITKCLPQQVQTIGPTRFFSTETCVLPTASVEQIRVSLTMALELGQTSKNLWTPPTIAQTVALSEISQHSIVGEPLIVVDWNIPSVEISMKPIDSGNIFRANGTYFLIGLSGQLGQSLCHWMVTHGARNVVLTSRNPMARPGFINMIEELGATVKFMALDITSRDSLYSCYDEICRTMPPVIGVANGAMILEDQLFDNMTWESFDRQLAPKVDGSALLDGLFYTTNLDFFILFSSLSSILGNSGQAAYVVANQYMVALAAQRKKRGLAGSAIAISSLTGIGYLGRTERFDSDHFTKLGYRNISEQDYFQLFAEGILAGLPENSENSEIITGISPIYDDHTVHAQFRSDPKFSHFIMEKPDNQILIGITTTIPTSIRLSGVKSIEEATTIITESFIARLKAILHIPQEEMMNENVTLVEQGVDSIMAVDVRTWFLKELSIDMPVLKILGPSATIPQLVDESIKKLPPSIVDLSKFKSDEIELPRVENTHPLTIKGLSDSPGHTSSAITSPLATPFTDPNSELVDHADNTDKSDP